MVRAGEVDNRRVFLVLAITVMCSGMIYQVTAFALPKIFDQRLGEMFGDSVLGIGGTVTAVYLASALAQVIGGELADRYRLRSVYMVTQFAQLPILAAAFVLVHPALIPAAALMIGLNTAGQPAENALLARHTPAHWRGPRVREGTACHCAPVTAPARPGIRPYVPLVAPPRLYSIP